MRSQSKQGYRLLTALVCEGLPFVVKHTPSAARQRGLFAAKHISRKRTLPALLPVAAWSADAAVLARTDERYMRGLPGLAEAWGRHVEAVRALQQTAAAEGGLDLKFPRIAERLLIRMAKEHEAGFGNTSAVVSSLAAPKIDPVPDEWQALWSTSSQILREVCPDSVDLDDRRGSDQSSPSSRLHIRASDFFGVLAALHLNAVSIGEGSSALYTPLAFANHSCEPNLLVEFHGAAAELTAARDIQPGEELFIHYAFQLHDSFDELQRHLEFNYGFSCEKGGFAMSSRRDALSLVSGAFSRRLIGWLAVSPPFCALLCSLLSGRLSGLPWSLGLCLGAHATLLLLLAALPAAAGLPLRGGGGGGGGGRAAALALLLLPPLLLATSTCAAALLGHGGHGGGAGPGALLPTALAVVLALAALCCEQRELPATDMMQAVALHAQLLRAGRVALARAARATGVAAALILLAGSLLPWRLGPSSFRGLYSTLLVVFLVSTVMHAAHSLLLVFLLQPLNWSKVLRNDVAASTDLLRKCLQLGFAAAIKAGEAAEQKELATAGAVDVPQDMLHGFQAHAKHKPLAWELQVVRQAAIARKLLDGVRLPVLLPGPPITRSGTDAEPLGTLPIGAPFVRAIAMMDLMRLARYSRERRQAIYEDAATGKAIASAACTVVDNAVLRLQLLSVYIHQEVLGAKDVVLTSSAGVASAGASNTILPEVNLSGGLQWGAVEALKKAKSVQESTAYASIRRILGKQFGKLATATHNWLLKSTLPDSPFLPIERSELVWAIEGVTLLMQKAVNEDRKGAAQHLLPALLNSLVALQLALQDYGHAMYCANQKWKRVPPGCSAVTPNDVRAVGIAVDEGITRLLKMYGHVLRFYTFPAAYAGELKARLSAL